MAYPAPMPAINVNIPNIVSVTQLPIIKPKNRYFIHTVYKKNSKYVIESHLKQKYDLSPISNAFLPHKKCIYFWIHFGKNDALSLSINSNQMPCIAYIPTQGILCEKTRFALTLFKYYGRNAWQFTPQTFYVCYNRNKKSWNLSENYLKNIFNQKRVWITKTSTGFAGRNIYLFSGTSLQSLKHFLEENYSKIMEKRINNKKKLRHLEKSQMFWNSVIIQCYINEPLLFDGFYKFDIRIWALLATTNPSILFYKFKKLRICALKYNETDTNITDKRELSKHISNSTVSRANKGFDASTAMIDGRPTLCDYNGFIRFMYEMAVVKKQFNMEWFETKRYKQLFMKNTLRLDDMECILDLKFSNVLSAVYDAAKQSFDDDSLRYNRPCQFAVHGTDVMIDKYGKFWALEINQTPTMFNDHSFGIKKMMKDIVRESIDIVMEIRDLKMKGNIVNQYTPLKTPKLWRKAFLEYRQSAVQIVDGLMNNIDLFLRE